MNKPLALAALLLGALSGGPALAQVADAAPPAQIVAVDQVTEDAAIAQRIERILEASAWFEDLSVEVDDGLVVLAGNADSAEHRDWAEDLAGRTQDVVAVINRLGLQRADRFNLTPAVNETRALWRALVESIPRFVASLVLLSLAWLVARGVRRLMHRLSHRYMDAPVLRRLLTTLATLPIWLLALFWVLNILGLTRLAATLVGGTGLAGLVIGIAFRDIAENFLASVLLSIERPFKVGDRIEVAGFDGVVQSMTTRGTLLMTLEGNHVQIPNRTLYKESIVNFTANPNIRLDFLVGVG